MINQSAPAPDGQRRRWSLNPVARKRWMRFRSHKRGFWSLCLLVLLYVISLFAEFICNDRPLVVRHEGHIYFPVVRFYPEDLFAGNGKMTRPDYKKIHGGVNFASGSGNWMIFPPVPYGPNEIIDPATLRSEEEVTLSIKHVARVGSVNIDREFKVIRSQAADVFLEAVEPGSSLLSAWPLPEEIVQSVRGRLSNLSQPAVRATITNLVTSSLSAEVSLSAYSPRREAPRDIRLTMREILVSSTQPLFVVYDRDLNPRPSDAAWWDNLPDETRDLLAELAAAGFDGILVPQVERVHGVERIIERSRNDIQWPFRPGNRHLLGIDNAGRDVFARILYGLRTSMTFGILLVFFSMGFGTIMGAVQGYYGGRIDLVSQRLIEIWSTVPFLYVMIWLGSIYGRSFGLLLLCYGIFNWMGISSYVRAEFLRLRRMPFVDAARCLGLSGSAIMFRHILPNALTPIITFFPFSLVGAIGSLAMLDYLGFGLPPPTPSWGELLQQAQSFRWAWWLILYPSLALFAVMLMGVFIGEGVRDANDPKPVMRME